MMERVETRPTDVRFSCLSPVKPYMEAYSAGSRKNLKHDEEKSHAAGSKMGKKRPKKLEEVEKEPHAAGSKKKKKALPPEQTLEEMLQVEEPEDFPRLKWKTVKLQLTKDNVNHFEKYIPPPPYRHAARHQAWLESSKRAVQQFKEKGSAELELDLLDDECDSFSELKNFLNDPEV